MLYLRSHCFITQQCIVNLFFCIFCGKSSSVSKVRVRHSYQDIMDACCKGLWPNWSVVGGWMINIAQVKLNLLRTSASPIHRKHSSQVFHPGLVFDINLIFENHISNIFTTAFFYLSNVARVYPSVSFFTSETSIFTFIIS